MNPDITLPDIERLPVNIKWTPELDAELERSLHNGLSYTQIALKLRITRCAVAGRVHRLRRKGAKSSAPPSPQGSKKRLAQIENGDGR